MKYYMNNIGYDSIEDAMEAFDRLGYGGRCRVTDKALEVKGITGDKYAVSCLSMDLVESDRAKKWVEDALILLEGKGSNVGYPVTDNRVLDIESDDSTKMRHYGVHFNYVVPVRFDAKDDEQAKAMLDTIEVPHIEGAEYIGDLDLWERDDDDYCIREVYR